MSLNEFRDEAGQFMTAIGAGDEHATTILDWLDEETAALKDAASSEDMHALRHQIYDVLFLLFELAAKYDLDLDAEWTTGRERKQDKYSAEDRND